ncbi:aspartate/glutamate racemase family protein [Pectobacterium brasiliense]|uniref:aspartate/glutamate racemase family protein n=1 Tax=Pectobacterium brasiliense TaxID=180957 RepID=UPI000AC1867F|nr:aspartate/glutamate racemase family protein [Pectobacterium brasiliense]
MRKARFTEHQIITVLKSVEAGRTVKDACREAEISEASYYNWKAKFGGMGSGATVDAMQKLIKNTPAYRDQDHIPMIAVSIPDIPDRTKCILQHSASQLDKMLKYMKILENAGAECIIIPCNTAHYWFNDLKQQCRAEMSSIIDLPLNALIKISPK